MRNALLFVLMSLWATPCLSAEVYPTKPVRVIVATAPSGGPDITARLFSQRLSEQLGKQFIVDNRAGANGIIGNAIVAKSAPDGYTLLAANPGLTIQPSLYKSLPFDVARDFTAITQLIRATQVLVVHPSVNASTLKEFIALAQAYPGKFNYGEGGS